MRPARWEQSMFVFLKFEYQIRSHSVTDWTTALVTTKKQHHMVHLPQRDYAIDTFASATSAPYFLRSLEKLDEARFSLLICTRLLPNTTSQVEPLDM
jgi:hypothetical protein